MRILIAPNAFKHSLDANDVAEAVSTGLSRSKLKCTVELFPVGDGGDGTARLIVRKFNGENCAVSVCDPMGQEIESQLGLINEGKTAVIEMADASGLRLVQSDELDPFQASSAGTGDLVRSALERGVTEIIIGLGGSATVDGGAGLLYSLGVRFLDEENRSLLPQPAQLRDLKRIDISGIDQRLAKCKIVVLCDVDNILLGETGSVAVFGPQKGVKQEDLPEFENVMRQISEQAFIVTGRRMDMVKHGGAAGGLAAALFAFCGAELTNGAEYFLEMTNFKESLKYSDLLITGEGSLDEQTLQGKAPFAVARAAKQAKIPVVGIGGKVPLEADSLLSEYFDVLIPIGHQPSDLKSAIANASANLIRTGTLIGNFFAVSQNK